MRRCLREEEVDGDGEDRGSIEEDGTGIYIEAGVNRVLNFDEVAV